MKIASHRSNKLRGIYWNYYSLFGKIRVDVALGMLFFKIFLAQHSSNTEITLSLTLMRTSQPHKSNIFT